LFTLTDGEPPVRFVSVPPEVAFCCTVHVAEPAFAADGAAAAPEADTDVSPYRIRIVSPAFNADGVVTVITWPDVVTFVVAYPPPAMFACVNPAALLVVFCGAVQFAGTAIVTAEFAPIPPLATVYVNTSVLLVVPANVDAGEIDADPEPSAALETVTVCVPDTVVRVPPEVDFSWVVKV
jgi:hypothetical protein